MFSKRAGEHRRWSVVLCLSALVLTIVIGAVLWQFARISSIIELEHNVSSLKPVFSVLRLAVILLIVTFWPALIGGFARWRQLSGAARTQLLGLRLRAGGWLVLLELVLGQNLLTHFVSAIQGMME